ncbi:MAG: antibiotic biosynthesis monooxygenase, partial [Oceanobacter sp.]
MVTETNGQEPVTVVVSRRVIPGKEAEFEELSTQMTEAAAEFEGHLGANMFRPVTKDDPEYRIIFRFASEAQLAIWENSAVRAEFLKKIESLLSSPTEREM